MIELHLLGTLDLRGAARGEPPSFVTGSKRLALLTYLALAKPRGFQRRDTLLVLLWPALDQRHARTALRNMIHLLRHSLGDGVLVGRGGEEVGLVYDLVRCDVHLFEQAVERGDFAGALELYRGDLLTGFHVSGASQGFEEWLESERARLRGQAAEAARGLVRSAEEREELREAIGWARRLAQLAPYDEEAWRTLIGLLDRTGNRATALRTYQGFAARLAEELGIAPAAETLALIDGVRSRPRPPARETSEAASGAATATAAAAPAATPTASDHDAGSAATRPRRRRNWPRPELVGTAALGRAGEAAELFGTAYSMIPPEFTPSQQARDRVWRLTHLATALAAAGDTAALAALPDSIQSMAQGSVYGRDRRLHHYVRGLLLAARGASWEEVAHEQRRALYAIVMGYTRINLELGHALIEAGRPDEAIAVLAPALRNTVQSNGFYITRAELHALVGHAWEAAGRPDSAAVHYRAVLEAWQNADPEFVPRREAIRARLAGLPQQRRPERVSGHWTRGPGASHRGSRLVTLTKVVRCQP